MAHTSLSLHNFHYCQNQVTKPTESFTEHNNGIGHRTLNSKINTYTLQKKKRKTTLKKKKYKTTFKKRNAKPHIGDIGKIILIAVWYVREYLRRCQAVLNSHGGHTRY